MYQEHKVITVETQPNSELEKIWNNADLLEIYETTKA